MLKEKLKLVIGDNVMDVRSLVNKLNAACESKDFDTVRELLHPDYTFRDPTMEFHSSKEFIEFMETCPFECHTENVEILSQGSRVVQTFDCVGTSPVPFRVRMCDLMTIEGGKVRDEEVFYDPAQFPKEALARNAMQEKGFEASVPPT